MTRSRSLSVAAPDPLEHALAAGMDGEVRFDAGSRAIYAHDASNYRQPPVGVVLPRHAEDVEHTLRTCRAHGAPVLSRGGGTSLAGQCVNHAVVMDFSKYMHRVLEVDAARRRVRVQPGCVLDDLRRALAGHGLTYGPDPATHNHCTLGGMLGNNSCGIHSVFAEFYGPGARTSDHVESLEILTYDGLRLRVGATSDAELDALIHAGGRIGEIYRDLARLRDRHADQLRTRFAPIPRRVSGYNLDELLPEHGFHVARALVGSEATCVTILEATLAVYPDRPARALCVLGYPDVYEAGDHIPQIREFRPVGLEGMDDRLIDDMKQTGLHASDVRLLPDGKGWLLVEFGADSRAEAEAQAKHMMEALRSAPNTPTMKLFDDPDEAHKYGRFAKRDSARPRSSPASRTSGRAGKTRRCHLTRSVVIFATCGRCSSSMGSRPRCMAISARAASTAGSTSTSRPPKGSSAIAGSPMRPPICACATAARCRASTATARRAASCSASSSARTWSRRSASSSGSGIPTIG